MVKITTSNIKFALIGGYGHGNLGDDALMLANVLVLSQKVGRKDITIVIRQPVPKYDYVHRYAPDCNISPCLPGHDIHCENIIYGGGTMFRAFPGIKKGFYKRTKEIVKKSVTAPSQAAKRVFIERFRVQSYPKVLAVRSFGLNIGLGPFIDNGRNIQETKTTLQQCKYLSVRDRYSESLCHRWDIKNVVQRADLCFCPELWGGTNDKFADFRKKLQHIGVIVREWSHTKEGACYKRSLQKTVPLLRSNGYHVKYIFFQYEPNWNSELVNMGEEVLAYSPQESSVQEFVESLRQFDLIITARAHGAIFATTLGIPSICIEIEPKLKYVCESLNGSSKLWRKPYDEKTLLVMVEEILGNLLKYHKLVQAAAKANRDLAELSVSEFLYSL